MAPSTNERYGVRSEESMEFPSRFRILRMHAYRFIFIGFLAVVLTAAGGEARHGTAAGTFQKALNAAREGDLSRSVNLWTRAIRRDPKSYAAHVNRGSALLMMGHVLRGIADWHKALQYSPVFAYALYSDDFIQQVPRNRRLLAYTKPLELDPEHTASVTMMGAMCVELGRTDTALKLYRWSRDLTRNPLLKHHFGYWIKVLETHPRR